MRKTIQRVLLVGAAAALGLGAAATTASAAADATGYARCPSGYFCIFAGANGTGTIAYFKIGSPDLRGQGIDNATTSFWNRNANVFTLCDLYNGVNHITDIFDGAQGNLDASQDNRASSVVRGPHGCTEV